MWSLSMMDRSKSVSSLLKLCHHLLQPQYERYVIKMFWILLIGSCCLSEVSAQQQEFRVRPAPVNVIHGGQAVLRCEVDNEAGPGRVQWTKDGFALGFDRGMTVYPRLSMIGNASSGVHNLRIQNVTFKDIAYYECQVLPRGGIRGIRAGARLEVLIPPSSIEILNHAPGAEITGKEKETISLECLARDARPAANVIWYKNDKVSLSTETLQEIQERTEVQSDGTTVKMNTTKSKITFFPLSENDGTTYTCEAKHMALTKTLKVSVTLRMQYPPGDPIIYGYTEGQYIRENEAVSVVCVSRGGKPFAELIWYKNGFPISSSKYVIGPETRNELKIVVTAKDNQARLRCEASNMAITTPRVTDVVLNVMFNIREVKLYLVAPSNVNITVNPQTLKEGQRVNLTCESASSNPSAKMTWFKDGVSIPSHSNYTLPGDNRGERAMSVLMLDLTSELDNAIYTCSAQNVAVKKSVHDTITLQVAYKPKFIENPGEKVTVEEGKSTSIATKAKGNPDQITYKWSKNGSPVVTTKGKVSVDGAELSFIDVSRKDKGKYEIEATNKEGTSTLNVELDVQYPATTVDTPFPWIMIGEGELANMECAIDANPLEESMVEWNHESADNSLSQLGERVERAFQDNKSYLTIKNVTANDAGLYFCTVNNGIGDATNRSIFLIVKHKPDIDLSPQIAKAASNKGENGKLICRAKGAPNVTFSWSREGRAIADETEPAKYAVLYNQVDVITWESIVVVKNVQAGDYGSYECAAKNQLGNERHTVLFDVTSAPEPPSGLHVVNFTHDSVTLTWIPGFDGGYEQSYKIRYIRLGSDNARYVEVFPKNMTIFTVTQLIRGTKYAFAVAAYNRIGESDYSTETGHQTASIYTQDGVGLAHGSEETPYMKNITTISASAIGVLVLVFNIACMLYIFYIKKSNQEQKDMDAFEQRRCGSAKIGMCSIISYTAIGETPTPHRMILKGQKD